MWSPQKCVETCVSQLPSWAKSQSGEVGSSRKQRGCAQGPIWDSERRRPCSAWTAVPVRAHVRLLSHVGFFVIPWTIARQAPLSMGILQARILEWVAMPSCRGSSQPRDGTHPEALGAHRWQAATPVTTVLLACAVHEHYSLQRQSFQSKLSVSLLPPFPQLCHCVMYYALEGSSIHNSEFSLK